MTRGPYRPSTAAHLFLACVLGSCGGDPAAPEGAADFRIEVSGETFVVEVTDAARVSAFEARLSAGTVGVVIGPLLGGDGGFNQPWSWHLDPAQTVTADAAIEVCDGRPSMVEAELEYWLDTVGSFCPWGARVVARIR